MGILTVTAFISISTLPSPGLPGPESRADYAMTVRLDPDSALLHCRSEITFMPAFEADTLWLHLYANAYRDPSTSFGGDMASSGYYGFEGAGEDEYGWILPRGWTLCGDSVEIEVDETLGCIPLARTVLPGDTIRLEGDFLVKVPSIWSRMGRDGDHFELTQWYPKLCVLDDAGWHLGQYRSDGEFFSDFGSYEVTLELPDSFVTAATGGIDSVWFSPDSLIRTERWFASEVHDFAWAADPAFVLVEHNFIPSGGLQGPPVRIHVAVQEWDEDGWGEVGAWADSTLLYYGEWYGDYPYGDLWIVQSAMWGGMEYPQLVMIGPSDYPFYRYFEMVVMHEIGHQWFYGMLGNDEVDEAWLDEGVNSFSEIRYFERKYGPRGNMTTLPGWIADFSEADETSSSYVRMAASGEEVPVLSTSTEASGGRYDYGALYYSKPALFVRMLQNQAGDEAFDRFMREYFTRFRFHHPGTGDFQAVLEETTGRSWQEEFDTWLRSTESSDIRVDGIEWSGDTTTVTVSGDIPIPVMLDLGLYGTGASTTARVSLEPGPPAMFRIPGIWRRAEIDPETRYLDRSPWNNSFPAAGTIRPLFMPVEQPSRYNTWLAPIPGYADGVWEAGAYGMMHSAGIRDGGPLELEGFWRQPLEGGRPGAWSLELERPLSRSVSGSASMSVALGAAYGREFVSAQVRRGFEGRYPSDPVRTISFTAGLESVSDNGLLDSTEFDEGFGAVLGAGASIWSRGRSGIRQVSIRLSGSPDWDGDRWISAETEGAVNLPGLPGSPGTRLFAGCVLAGDAPLQYSYRPGGGLAAGGILGWLLPPAGFVSPLEHYFVEEGPALPGYGESGKHGRIGIGLGETISLQPLPLSIFADAGWIEDSMADITASRLVSNAGLSLDAAFLRVWFPAWVSDPPPGEENWEMRWRFAFSLWGLGALLM